MRPVTNNPSPVLHPQGFNDICAENISIWANLAKSLFWKAEQNCHYITLPLQPRLFGQEEHKLYEIGKRVLIGPLAFTATLLLLPIGLLGHGLTALSNSLHSREFVYWEGLCNEIRTLEPKILHLNACMFAGGLPYEFGGLRTAGERFCDLIALIIKEAPDLFFLCEFSETITPRLYEALKNEYKHFFVNIGSNACGMDASLCIACKIPLVKEPQFMASQVEADGDQKMMYRGYFILETANHRYLYAHLNPKSERIRHEQFKEIQLIVKEEGSPWLILGDLNVDRGSSLHDSVKKDGFYDVIESQHGRVSTSLEGESIDYFLTFKDQPIIMVTKIIDTYDNRQKALSDHKAIVAEVKNKRP